MQSRDTTSPKLLIIGSGLAGTVAAVSAAEATPNLTVLVFDKEPKPGGNSVKASSGINSLTDVSGDTSDIFREDTLKSGGGRSIPALVEVLVDDSTGAMKFLEQHGAKLDSVVQLGGHSLARTRTPSHGPNVGFALMKALGERLAGMSNIHLVTGTKVTDLLVGEGGKVTGVRYVTETGQIKEEHGNAVILATGGFGANKELLKQYAPQAADLATTNGAFSTGDGLSIAQGAGAALIDLDAVQVHPTGFVDPADPDNKSKILAPEKLRGVGGILLGHDGRRFVNELSTRDKVSAAIMQQPKHLAYLVLEGEGASQFGGALGFYVAKGLLKPADTVADVAKMIGVSEETLTQELAAYNSGMEAGADAFGRPTRKAIDLENKFYVALITPVVHYTMGGVAIGENAEVLALDNKPIPGLFAAGEVAGGVHGANRLGGNSLLECVVFGRRAGLTAVKHLS